MTPEERKEELTKCLLSQYRLCAAGTIGGAGFSVLRSQSARPTAWPMLGGAVRSLFLFARFIGCFGISIIVYEKLGPNHSHLFQHIKTHSLNLSPPILRIVCRNNGRFYLWLLR